MRRIIALATALGLVLSVLLTVASVTQVSAYTPADDGGSCVPTPDSYTEWHETGQTPVQHGGDPVPPGPDTDLKKYVGPTTSQHQIKDATDGGFSDWVNSGGQIRTEENAQPGATTSTERWIYVGPTAAEVIVAGQHYSLKGNSGLGKDDVPVPPTPDNDGYWQPNTTQEPHSSSNVTWPNGFGNGLHFTSHGPAGDGNRDWFYFRPPVTDIDYLWQKQVRTEVPGTPAEYETDSTWTIYERELVPGQVCDQPEVVPFPEPTQTDPCGSGNATWNVPADTEQVHWNLTDDGRLIGVTQDGFVWPNATTVNSWGHATDSGELCPPMDAAFPAQFDADPTPPTCDTDGALPSLTEFQEAFPNVTFSISPSFTGPGQYTVAVTPNPGFAFDPADVPAAWTLGQDGSASRVITVAGALGFQSSDPTAACYVAPPEECVSSPSPETCPQPEGTRNEVTTEECVAGDLVTTYAVTGTNPVWNEVTLEWELVPFDSSSEDIEENATKCALPPLNPDGPNNPNNPNGPNGPNGPANPDGQDGSHSPSGPNVPTVIDAGLTSVGPESDRSFDFGLLTGAMLALVFSMLGVATIVRGTGSAK